MRLIVQPETWFLLLEDGDPEIQNSIPLPRRTHVLYPTCVLPPIRSIFTFSIFPPNDPVSPWRPNPLIAILRTVQFLMPLTPLPYVSMPSSAAVGRGVFIMLYIQPAVALGIDVLGLVYFTGCDVPIFFKHFELFYLVTVSVSLAAS